MPVKSDPYTAQISKNIFKLSNLSPIPFDITSIFGLFNQPALLRFFEQHQQLGHDIAPFVFAMLVHVAVMLDGAEIFNPDGTGFLTSLNLFVHLIGEPGTNKSGLFRTFNHSLNVLKKIFPSFFSKQIQEIVNGKEKETAVELIANNDTELSLYQRLSKRENVFISTDELDVINNRFGVYLAGNADNDGKTVGSKLLCQGYDTIKDSSRTTGSSSFYIERGSINIFGASTGNMLSPICRQYNSEISSDGTISRYLFVTTSAHKTSNELPEEILSVQPNIVHILIVVRLLAQYKPIFVFGEYSSQKHPRSSIAIPPDIEEARKHIQNPIPLVEKMSVLKPNIIISMEKANEEVDGSILSPYSAIRRIIDSEYQKSLQIMMNDDPLYTPLQRAFQRKSSNKLARLAGICQTISYAIQLCTKCINIIRFGDGLYLKEFIDNEELTWLQKFHNTVNEVIQQDMAKAPKYGCDKRPLLLIEKAAVNASQILYQYNDSTASTLFSDTPAMIVKKSKKNDVINTNDVQLSKDAYYEEQAILLKMTSPILIKAWFNNVITGLPFTTLFTNYRKSTEKTLKLTQAIEQLVAHGLLQKGIKHTRHIVTARKETYLKTSPVTIRQNPNMLDYLQSIGIDIDNYEHVYLISPLPMNMELTSYTVDSILSNNDYIEFCHLFNDARIQRHMEQLLLKNEVQHRMMFGRKQYYVQSSSQIMPQNNTSIPNSQIQDNDDTQENNNPPLPVAQSPHPLATNIQSPRPLTTNIQSPRPLTTNIQSPVVSTDSEHSSLFYDMRHLIMNCPLLNNTPLNQMVIDVEPKNNFEYDELSMIEDTLNQLSSMIAHSSSNTTESTLTSNTNDTIVPELVLRRGNLYDKKNHQQQLSLVQSELGNMELPSYNHDNGHFASIETTSRDASTFLENMNSQETFEFISELIRNKKDIFKRIFEQENDEYLSKRSRTSENEDTRSSNTSIHFNSNGSLLSTSSTIQSNGIIGNVQVNERDSFNSIPNPTSSTPKSGIHFVPLLNIDNTSASMEDIFPQPIETSSDDMSNKNTSCIPKDDNNSSNASNSFPIPSTTITTIESTTGSITESTNNDISATNESNRTNDQEETIAVQQNGDDTALLDVYKKLMLTNSVVMSKSDICAKLKHVSNISTLRDDIISTLVKEKLLIEGNWFATKRANGNISPMLGYLKTFPKNDVQNQQDFARLLTKYQIHYDEYEQSFKRNNNDSFPRTLDASDIKQNKKWLFSTELADVIGKNNFLHERISIDPSAIIQGTNVSSTHTKRQPKPQKRYSPSDAK